MDKKDKHYGKNTKTNEISELYKNNVFFINSDTE